MKTIDRVGQRFGKLLVLRRVPHDHPKRKKVMWLCRCDCGKESAVLADNLRSGHTESCGCSVGNVKHGLYRNCTYPPLAKVYFAMRSRCLRTNDPHYNHYGGRGIKVCDRWLNGDANQNGLQCFLEDMGPRPKGLTLDRIDNDGPYSPENCRWATMSDQNRNRRDTVMVTVNGRTVPAMTAAEDARINWEAFRWRRRAGWPVDVALSTPVKKVWKKPTVTCECTVGDRA